MTYNSLIKKLGLSEPEFKDIDSAVQKAESGTRGEIALAVVAESDSYAFWELSAAIYSSFLVLCCLFPFTKQISAFLGKLFWTEEVWHVVAFYMAACVIVIAVFYILYNIPWFDSLIIPRRVKQKAVMNRAMRYFAESGVYCTSKHSGILVFVSYFEHEVRIIADKGLNDNIADGLWEEIADEVAQSIAKKSAKDGFLAAVEKCGEVFAKYFPLDTPDEYNPNELSDGLVILKE